MITEALVTEALIGAAAEAVFGYLLDQSGVAGWIRARLGREPEQLAFKIALAQSLRALATEHPGTVADALFDETFLKGPAAPLLAHTLTRTGTVTAITLAAAWADHLGLKAAARENHLATVMPVAQFFLQTLDTALRNRLEFQNLFDSKALDITAAASEATVEELTTLRHELKEALNQLQTTVNTLGGDYTAQGNIYKSNVVNNFFILGVPLLSLQEEVTRLRELLQLAEVSEEAILDAYGRAMDPTWWVSRGPAQDADEVWSQLPETTITQAGPVSLRDFAHHMAESSLVSASAQEAARSFVQELRLKHPSLKDAPLPLTAGPTEAILMVQVQPRVGMTEFGVRAWLIPDISAQDPYARCVIVPSLSDPKAVYDIQELESLVEAALRYCNENVVPGSRVTVEFFLPYALMDTAVEEMEIVPSDTDHDPFPLWQYHHVIVRAWERLQLSYRRSSKMSRWLEKWQFLEQLEEGIRHACESVVEQNAFDWSNLRIALLRSDRAGVIVVGEPSSYCQSDRKRNIFTAIGHTGVPLAIWTRRASEPQAVCETIAELLDAGSLVELPKRVRDTRLQSWSLELDPRKQLVLMLENPTRLTPDALEQLHFPT